MLGPDAVEVSTRRPRVYLYRDKFSSPSTATIGSGRPSCPGSAEDEFFGEVETYRGEVRIRLPFKNAGAANTATLVATSQAAPTPRVLRAAQQTARLTLAAAGAVRLRLRRAKPSEPVEGLRTNGAASSWPGSAHLAGPGADDTVIARLFQGGFALLVLSFFGFGLLLSFTPCVLPMIPILSGIIVGRGASMTRVQGFTLSAAYVLGMALTYAAAGVLAGLSGAMLSATLQNPWVVGSFAAVFVLLAVGMFGFYELQLPARCRPARRRDQPCTGGHLAGVFSMGALSALIAARASRRRSRARCSNQPEAATSCSAVRHCSPWRSAWACRCWLSAPPPALCCRKPALDETASGSSRSPLGVAIYLVAPLVPPPLKCLHGRRC